MWPVPEAGFKKCCDSRPVFGYSPYPSGAASASRFHHNNCSIFKRNWGEVWGIVALTYVHLRLYGFLFGACGHKKAGRFLSLHLFINSQQDCN